MIKPNYLTKSLFKTGFECPAKLRYAKDKSYGNSQNDNDFLMALAEGGFQVGELAKLMFPGGHDITTLDHTTALAQTAEKLSADSVVVFEAALSAGGVGGGVGNGVGADASAYSHGDDFVRVDVLRKTGNTVDIIEVKSKSYDPNDTGFFKNTKGEFASGLLPYLLDVAFQTHVAQLALPACQIRSFLLLPNKARAATVDGLNQLFPIVQVDAAKRRVKCEPLPGLTLADLGDPLLELLDVTDHVTELLQRVFEIPGMAGTVASLAEALVAVLHNPRSIAAPIGSHCKTCQFRLAPEHPLKNGFDECWRETVDNQRLDAGEPLVTDLWDGRKTASWMQAGKRFISDIQAQDLPLQVESDRLSRTHRQWLQISGDGLNDDGYLFDTEGFAKEVDTWTWPINLIDFETSRTALPFHRGGKPYGLVAFQWSHHILHEDNTLVHVADFLQTEPGALPNVAFLRTLRDTLSRNDGSVMMWSPYENSVLNALLDSLSAELPLDSNARDYAELLTFVETLTTRKQGTKVIHRGERAMVDLCKLSSDLFFHRRAGGSNSIKKVLPAMLTASAFLKDFYGQAVYGGGSVGGAVGGSGCNSLNFKEPMTWWQLDARGQVIDPYQLLPGVFDDLDVVDQEDDASINQGGAAATAYARLQFEAVNGDVREAWRQALLKYCELDTLAMAMIVQGWRAWLANPPSRSVG